MLYLVATPIGNLEDITYRAVRILGECDLILCEDTRHSRTLLQHYDIQKPLKSHHKFNEASRIKEIITLLKAGKTIALISDAGTPVIADPGERIVRACIEEALPISSVPGPCALIASLCCSGLATHPFQFVGFLPKKQIDLRRHLMKALAYPGTTIAYESPHRLLAVLRELATLNPSSHIAVGRELTKKFEEIRRGTPEQLLEHWENHPPKGEIVLLIQGGNLPTEDILNPEETVAWLEKSYALPQREAIKLAAELHGLPKRSLYQKFI